MPKKRTNIWCVRLSLERTSESKSLDREKNLCMIGDKKNRFIFAFGLRTICSLTCNLNHTDYRTATPRLSMLRFMGKRTSLSCCSEQALT